MLSPIFLPRDAHKSYTSSTSPTTSHTQAPPLFLILCTHLLNSLYSLPYLLLNFLTLLFPILFLTVVSKASFPANIGECFRISFSLNSYLLWPSPQNFPFHWLVLMRMHYQHYPAMFFSFLGDTPFSSWTPYVNDLQNYILYLVLCLYSSPSWLHPLPGL